MPTFISDTLDDILRSTTSFENVIFVLPSQRAGVFLKKELQQKISSAFLPQIFNIEEFIAEISETKKADSVQLLFHFYSVYKELEPNPDSFANFSAWAFTVLQDFNEIDQHLIDAKDIFTYLKDIERLRKWSVKGELRESELMKNHHRFMERLYEYYMKFYAFLLEKKSGYQGFMYREAANKVTSYLAKNESKKFFFIGFNALNKAEEFLFQEFLGNGNSQIYWDLDTAFYKGNHQAGNFIRKYKKNWKYFEKNELKTIHDSFSEPKNIQIIGTAKNTMQLKYAGEILDSITDFTKTALVLSDESLLPIALNSLPKKVNAINITMGYPLKDMPTTNLIFTIFNLFISQEKLQKTATNEFYFKEVLSFFKHPLIHQYLSLENSKINETISKQISETNSTFLSFDAISKLLLNGKSAKVLLPLFLKFNTVDDFINRILSLINTLKENVNQLEKEYLFRFYTAFTQLQNLNKEFGYFEDLKTLHQFFKQIIASETLSFQGEPLRGLQLMGMLETRLLDFENVIITSVNEGILPANSSQSSFIPFDVKVSFGLPTYREKDAIFSYHFFRLMQRAKNVYLLYNTENDSFGKGEKSRFITQLEMIRTDVSNKTINAKVVTEKTELQQIQKTEKTQKKLRELAEKGISPSAFTNYLVNPIGFYKQKILRIDELQEVEETVAFNTLGNVVHDTLDELYSPFKGKFLNENDVVEMQKKATALVKKYFVTYFKSGDLKTGKNRLIFEVANRFVKNFLSKEKVVVSNPDNQLKIIDTEPFLSAEIKIDGIEFPIKIHGKIDRIDELNGVTRIIDYKTGKVEDSNLKVTDFEEILEYKKHKAIQVLLYSFLYTKHTNFDFSKPLEAGIYSFKNLNSGFLKANFSKSKPPENNITPEILGEFMEVVKSVLKEIYNQEIPFLEPEEMPY